MNRLDTLREQIDAVRPDSDDLSLSSLAEVAQAAEEDRAVADELDRSQQFDRAVAAALHDVPVPADLLERLLARAAESPQAEAPAAVSLPPPRARVSRRMVIALASIAAAALLAVSISNYWPRAGRNVSKAELSETALQWYDQIPMAEGWTPVGNAAQVRSMIPAAVISTPTRRRDFQTVHGRAVVYDLATPTRPKAWLFAVRTRDRFTGVAATPFTVLSTSGRRGVAAWQSGEMLYVLVIDRDRQRLEDHIRLRPEA